jgi:hypothetical protein
MSRELVISFDDYWEGNSRTEELESLYKEFPDIKITLFVITGKCSEEFLKNAKNKNTQLCYHSHEHAGEWLNWTKERTKELLLDCQKLGFEQGLKVPAYKWKEPHIKACDELGYWICSGSTVPVTAKKYWHTSPYEGLTKYPNKEYDEYYDHFQREEFCQRLEELKQFIRETRPTFKFISEKIITNTCRDYEQQNLEYYWK